MQRIIKIFIASLIAIMVVISAFSVSANDSTTYTYTVSVTDNWIRTQDAYIPSTILAKQIGLNQPGDIFFYKNLLYISDTGNSRIVVLNISNKQYEIFGGSELKSPDGLYVTDDGTVYVADPVADAVLIYSPEHKLEKTIPRPKNDLFSKSSMYNPCSIAVSSVGNIFVVGKGAYEGIMQFDKNGEFFGYFAANRYKMSAKEKFEQIIYNEKQLSNLFVRTPRPIDNIDISSKDIIYSVTRSDDRTGSKVESTSDDTLKKHNMAGLNVFSQKGKMKEEWNFTDVASGPNGEVYAVTQTGIINEYDQQGNLVFTFGGRAYNNDRNGIFTNAQAIDVDPVSNTIFVMDSERGLIQVFYPTDYANLTHNAIKSLDDGDYKGSEGIWANLLKLNGMSQIAHIGYGKSLFYQQKYEDALNHFKIANNISYYSQTKWEIRSQWLNQNMKYILIGVVILIILLFFYFRKRKKNKKNNKIINNKFYGIWKDIEYIKNMIRHPLDSLYYLRRGEKGSILSATIIFVIYYIIFILNKLVRGYIFRPSGYENLNVFLLSILFFIPLILWIITSYMIGTINEGEGFFKQIYICTAYSFAPSIILTPIIIVLSHVLTLNEGFIINFGSTFILIWTGILIFLSIKEVQQYSFGETLKSVFLAIFFMIMIIVAFAIIYLLIEKIIIFFKEIIGEGIYRVSK